MAEITLSLETAAAVEPVTGTDQRIPMGTGRSSAAVGDWHCGENQRREFGPGKTARHHQQRLLLQHVARTGTHVVNLLDEALVLHY